jgi:DNA polymerase-3 subunit delta
MTIYILHGENGLERDEAVAGLVDKLDLDESVRDLNLETLPAPLDLEDFRRACGTLPFLGDVRVVIVRDGLSKTKKGISNEIADYLSSLPPSTHLIFSESKKLRASHPVMKEAKKLKAKIKEFPEVKARYLANWIRQRAKMRGCQMRPDAVRLLAENIGTDLRLLDQEIQKLKLYKGDKKLVTVEDVKLMVPYVQSADVIFDLVDALGQGNARNAARHLHRLLDVGEHPLGVFGMVVRQYRLLIQARWLLDRGKHERDVRARLKLHPFVAGKICGQAGNYTLDKLRRAYDLLVESDLAIKRGKMSPEAALDLLVVQLTELSRR